MLCSTEEPIFFVCRLAEVVVFRFKVVQLKLVRLSDSFSLGWFPGGAYPCLRSGWFCFRGQEGNVVALFVCVDWLVGTSPNLPRLRWTNRQSRCVAGHGSVRVAVLIDGCFVLYHRPQTDSSGSVLAFSSPSPLMGPFEQFRRSPEVCCG